MAVESRAAERWPSGSTEPDDIVVEEPLEIRIEGHSLAVTMRTPGHDLDLAAGFLLSEGVIDAADDLVALAHVGPPTGPQNVVDCVLAGGVEAHRERISAATRELYATSSCGLCGKASLDRLEVLLPPLARRVEFTPELLASLPRRLREVQPAFRRTGGLHAAALFFADGSLDVAREDIGRHNAVDKVLGHRLRTDRVPADDVILVVSSRASFEIVQKARVAGITAVASVGAASTLAIDLAKRSSVRLHSFVRDGRWTRYA